MKLFQQQTNIQIFSTAKNFVTEFEICETDFILASQSIFEVYFEKLELKAQVVYKSKYGQGEPTDNMMDELMADFKQTNCSRIIAIGGGSVIDMAKLLVVRASGSARAMFEKNVPIEKVREFIAIPTTCGAGSEVSNVTIAEISELHTKMGLADDALYADYAVLIPELLKELPYEFFATSAIDAFIHAIESYVSPRATMYTEMFSEKAIQIIVNGFQSIVTYGEAYRYQLLDSFLIASNMAGVSFGNAGTGAVHAMSYPLSGVYHVTHGEANYQFFTEVFKEYSRRNPEGKLRKMNQMLADILKCEVDNVYIKLDELLGQIIPKKPLHEYGMKETEIITFADSVLESQQRLLQQSYVLFSRDQMIEIYSRLY
ncbi:4-hydroxybutyrate dehydrogenase [Lachnospiraceae bacterium LCP25S3_G4]